MAHLDQQRIEMAADRGSIVLCSFCSPDDIAPLSFDEFRAFPQYSPIISKKESLIKAAQRPDANVSLAWTSDNKIVGFCILEYPASGERWLRVGDRLMMEVSVVEVSRSWRGAGLAKKLVHLVVNNPANEDRILYMVGYSWTWDLDNGKIPAMAYRDMMIRLFSSCGFEIFQTNEPNIMLRPENLFMARIGKNISEMLKKKFKMVRFNLE